MKVADKQIVQRYFKYLSNKYIYLQPAIISTFLEFIFTIIALALLLIATYSYIDSTRADPIDSLTHQSVFKQLKEMIAIKDRKKVQENSLIFNQTVLEDQQLNRKRRIRQISSKVFALSDQNNQFNPRTQQFLSNRNEEMNFYKQKSRQPQTKGLKYAILNLGNKQVLNQLQQLSKIDQEIFISRYKIDQYTSQIPLCILIYISDFEDIQTRKPSFRSIFNQQYTNYRIIAILDGVRQFRLLQIYKFIDYQGSKKDIKVVEYREAQGFGPTVLRSMKEHSHKAEIAVVMLGKDQMLSKYSLSIFNSVYQKQKPLMVYGNYLQYRPSMSQLYLGSSKKFNDYQFRANQFRYDHYSIGPLLSFNIKMANRFRQQFFEDRDGNSFKSQQISFLQLGLQALQLSCGKTFYINEYHYLLKKQDDPHFRKEESYLSQRRSLKCIYYEIIQ